MAEENKIYIKEPFREQYTLTIDSDINAVNALISSTIKIRYDFQVLDITKEFIQVRLLVLENQMLKANNPMVKEVAQVSQVFGRMYSELHLHISPEGKVLKVLNTDLILSKWAETKAEMKKHISGNPEMEQAISLNDAIYKSPDKVKIAVQANEFFAMYFGVAFNELLPKAKRITGTNIFNTANLEWNINTEEMSANSSQETICILTNMNPVRPFSVGYLNAAYHQFKDQVTIDSQNIKMFQREERYIERNTGKLNESTIRKTEEIESKKLFQKFTYRMISDTEKKIRQEKIAASKQAEENKILVSEAAKEAAKPKIYKVVDGKELTYEEWKIYEQHQWEIHKEKSKKKGFFGF